MSVERWKKNDGEKTLREIGIKKGQTVLDFGCSSGIYTLIVARIVGKTGRVYALDEKKRKLKKLKKKTKHESLENVETIHTSGEIQISLEKASIDVFLMYDVYHLLSESEREALVREASRVLKKGGFLSYHATHLSEYGVDLQNVHQKMQKARLKQRKKLKKQMFHWQWIEKGTIYNYYKE